jgi:quercetin dioxygenase-like cupin family protein
MDPVFSARGEGEPLRNPVGAIEFKARAEQTAGTLTAFESETTPGEGPPLHVHNSESEMLYFLEGRFRVRIDDAVRDAPEGSFVLVPKGVQHTWQNIGDAPARILVMFLPAAAGMEQFMTRFAAEAERGSMPETFAKLAEVGGMDVVGPPLAQSHPLA